MSFDPATVAAFVDGELDDLTARRVEREAESDPALAAEIARHRALKARLAAHYAPIAEEPVPERLRALLASGPSVDTSLAVRREAKRMRFAPIHWGAIAASRRAYQALVSSTRSMSSSGVPSSPSAR